MRADELTSEGYDLPWPLVFAYSPANDTLLSTKIDGRKMLLAFPDEETFWAWLKRQGKSTVKAQPSIDADPATLLPLLGMMQKAGGNDAVAVFYPDPPDKWRVQKVALDLIFERLRPLTDPGVD